MRKVALSLSIIGLAWPLLAAPPVQAQAQRTWVSGTGDNANPCSRTAPCRTFQGALAGNKTAAGGEINCLDTGDFGQVTITFSVTISCAAGTAGILAAAFQGIFINAAATDVVTLRGLDIDAQGTGDAGISIASAGSVRVEKCTIRNFRRNSLSAGITSSGSQTTFLHVAETVISDNWYGIRLTSSGGFKVASLKNVVIKGSTLDGLAVLSPQEYANVTQSVISGNGGTAVNASGGATVNIDRSTIANNGLALASGSGGSIIRISGNTIYNNTTGFGISPGATIQSDGTNNAGGSNGGAGVPNATLTKN
jgi:hypothetical protein